MPCSRGGLSIGVPPSSLAWGSSGQSPQRQRVHVGGLVKGQNGGLHPGGNAHTAWLRELANSVVSRGHSRGWPAYVQSEQALMNTAEVTWQHCSVYFGWLPNKDLTSLPVDLWGRVRDTEWVLGVAGSRDAGTSGAGAVCLMSAQMMGQQQQQQQTYVFTNIGVRQICTYQQRCKTDLYLPTAV